MEDDAVGTDERVPCEQDEARRIIQGDFGRVQQTALSEDGSVVILSGVRADTQEGSIWRWSESTGAAERVLTARPEGSLAVSADGATLLAEDDAGDVLWRAGAVVRLPFDRHPWDCLPQLSRDGASVVGCAGRRAVLVRDGVEAALELPFGFEASMPLAINVDGSAIAGLAYSLNAEGDAIDSTSLIWTLDGDEHHARVLEGYRAVAISDDGRRAIVLTKVIDPPFRASALR